MRVSSVAKVFAGSCVVYLVMAACSAYSNRDNPAASSSTSSSSGDPPPLATVDGPVPNALAEGFKSGSRLKLRFWEGADGSRQFIDFFDTQLETPCAVSGAKTSDGKTRCLPPRSGQLYFSDAACKVPVAYAVEKARDPQPKVAAVSNGNVAEHYALGPLMTPPSVVYAGGEDGATGNGECAQATFPAAQNAYAVGAPLAPTAFVEMTIKTE